jgi:hypothetical protein
MIDWPPNVVIAVSKARTSSSRHSGSWFQWPNPLRAADAGQYRSSRAARSDLGPRSARIAFWGNRGETIQGAGCQPGIDSGRLRRGVLVARGSTTRSGLTANNRPSGACRRRSSLSTETRNGLRHYSWETAAARACIGSSAAIRMHRANHEACGGTLGCRRLCGGAYAGVNLPPNLPCTFPPLPRKSSINYRCFDSLRKAIRGHSHAAPADHSKRRFAS